MIDERALRSQRWGIKAPGANPIPSPTAHETGLAHEIAETGDGRGVDPAIVAGEIKMGGGKGSKKEARAGTDTTTGEVRKFISTVP